MTGQGIARPCRRQKNIVEEEAAEFMQDANALLYNK